MLDGNYRLYHENGQIKVKGQYKEGKEDGEWVGYYENGQIKTKKHEVRKF